MACRAGINLLQTRAKISTALAMFCYFDWRPLNWETRHSLLVLSVNKSQILPDCHKKTPNYWMSFENIHREWKVQGYYIKVKTIWALFTCSKNCLPKIHQIQPLNWPAHWNTILFSFLTISLSFLSAIAISNSARFQQHQSPRFIFTIKGQLFVWKVSFRKIIWCADFVENEMRDPSVITEIN